MIKRRGMMGVLIGAAVLFAATIAMAQPMGPGMMGRGYGYGPGPGYGYGQGGGYGNWSCPYGGGPMGPGYNGMGPGMMGRGYGYGPGPGYGPGYGMGPGMMGRGWGPAPYQGRQYEEPAKPLEEKDAKELVENYLKSTRNPNLKVGKIKDLEGYFEVEVVTKDDSLTDKIAVDKNTGWMRSVY